MDDSRKLLLTLSNRILSIGGKKDRINVRTFAGSTDSDSRFANWKYSNRRNLRISEKNNPCKIWNGDKWWSVSIGHK